MTDEADSFIRMVMTDMLDSQSALPEADATGVASGQPGVDAAARRVRRRP